MSRSVKPATPEQLAERIRQGLGLYPADLVIKNVRIFDIVGGQLTSATAGEEGPGGAPRPQQRLPPPALVDFARQGPDRDAAISSGWTVA